MELGLIVIVAVILTIAIRNYWNRPKKHRYVDWPEIESRDYKVSDAYIRDLKKYEETHKKGANV